MKKINQATKRSETAKGCMKISSFFTKPSAPLGGETAPNMSKRKLCVEEANTPDCSAITKKPDNDQFKSEPSSSRQQRIIVKSPEKLLTPEALKRLTTPEKQHVNNPKNSRTPRSLCKNEVKKSTLEKTPQKKCTAKKLFESPVKNLREFNVGVLERFITPKKESDLPKVSDSAIKAQNTNEMTPTKQGETQRSSPARAKTKLDFSAASNGINHENDLNLSNIEMDFDDSWDAMTQLEFVLDFTKSQYCKIIEINPLPKKTVLIVKSLRENHHGICSVSGFWLHTTLKVSDVVHIMAEKNQESEWIISNECGLLVYEPDLLLSTTTVVNSLFCKRKSVLAERFRGFDFGNKFMTVGTLVHELLQRVLKNKTYKQTDIEEIIEVLVTSKKAIHDFYALDLTIEEIKSEMLNYVPRIQEFISSYIEAKPKRPVKYNWTGTIKSIDDIEDNIWCPELGVKGKIDVTITTTSGNLVPLEVKTGRASVSLEHRGQVMLYIMMMNKLGIEASSGLLLYLKEGVLREIPMNQQQKRDIIILRNELAVYLNKKSGVDEEGRIVQPELPEGINHPSCSKCEHRIVCSAFLRHNKQDLSSNDHLRRNQEIALKHLNDADLNYFMHWNSLLGLEANSQNDNKDVRQIYTMTPEEREAKGTAVINLALSSFVTAEINGIYEHTFLSTRELRGCALGASSYVVISTDRRPAIATGFVKAVDPTSVIVALDRDLQKKYSGQTFHIDTYDSMSWYSFNTAGLALLLEPTETSEKLRRIIIEKTPPDFTTKLPKIIATTGMEILARLNRVQQRALLKAIAAKDYLLIKGMPGTGKTSTVVALIELLVMHGKTVLITSHTHSAVDNVCLKLRQFHVDFMRLGAEKRVHEELKQFSERHLTKDCKTPQELQDVYNRTKVFAVTCLGSDHPVLTKRHLDVCIVDESTQVLQTSLLRPLSTAKTFILLGDPNQLPAVIRSKEAVALGMSESLFERLDSPQATIALNINYRMNKTITRLANILTYQWELVTANDAVANACLELPKKDCLLNSCSWILQTLDSKLENAVQIVNTGSVWRLSHTVPWLLSGQGVDKQGCLNIYEAAVIFQLVSALRAAGISGAQIGVIATYRLQVAQISALLSSMDTQVSTVDQFQGKDKDVIIYSCGKSRENASTSLDLMEDKRRLTVAITRAKKKLILVGDVHTLLQYANYKVLLSAVQENVVEIQEKDWEEILDIK